MRWESNPYSIGLQGSNSTTCAKASTTRTLSSELECCDTFKFDFNKTEWKSNWYLLANINLVIDFQMENITLKT